LDSHTSFAENAALRFILTTSILSLIICSERLTLFGGGFGEIGFILFIAFLLFGPKKLPEIARTLGKGLGELRRASNELKFSLEEEIKNLDRPQENSSNVSPKYGYHNPEPTPKEPGQ
jgi:TatA/E family protein of Tat protein translocase